MRKKEYDALRVLLLKARETGMNAELAEQIQQAMNKPEDTDPLKMLSKRELQILSAIAAGTPPAQAAFDMEIAVKTFSTYRARVLEKLKLKSNAQLAILAFELNLVPSVLKLLKKEDSE